MRDRVLPLLLQCALLLICSLVTGLPTLAPRATLTISDPLWPNQWHLQNTGQNNSVVGTDIHILGAWEAGYNGNTAQVAIVDDGVEYTHSDFGSRYDSTGSYDFNDDDSDPLPVTTDDNHGTSAAGVAVAGSNNTCGLGSAYGASFSAIRLLAASHSISAEINALSFERDRNDIYSNSWGPSDCHPDLAVTSGSKCNLGVIPDGLRTQLADSVVNGRGGKGSIFVWAGGNGGLYGDNVNYDSYANSMYVIAVGAVSGNGTRSQYSEPGAALHVVAPSSGLLSNGALLGITTTDRTGTVGYSTDDCNSGFTGTSSSCPLVAGVVALLLQVSPDLGWRDVKYLLALSGTKVDVTNGGWITNGAGFIISDNYGFGLVNASLATELAADWSPVATMLTTESAVISVNSVVADGNINGIESTVIFGSESVVKSIEHVEVLFTASASRRGDLEVVLTSPSNTTSTLASVHDDENAGYANWRFMSVHHWGESAEGEWKLSVRDLVSGNGATFDSWQIRLHGLATPLDYSTICEVCFEIPVIPDEEVSEGTSSSSIIIPVAGVVGFLLICSFVWCRSNRKKPKKHATSSDLFSALSSDFEFVSEEEKELGHTQPRLSAMLGEPDDAQNQRRLSVLLGADPAPKDNQRLSTLLGSDVPPSRSAQPRLSAILGNSNAPSPSTNIVRSFSSKMIAKTKSIKDLFITADYNTVEIPLPVAAEAKLNKNVTPSNNQTADQHGAKSPGKSGVSKVTFKQTENQRAASKATFKRAASGTTSPASKATFKRTPSKGVGQPSPVKQASSKKIAFKRAASGTTSPVKKTTFKRAPSKGVGQPSPVKQASSKKIAFKRAASGTTSPVKKTTFKRAPSKGVGQPSPVKQASSKKIAFKRAASGTTSPMKKTTFKRAPSKGIPR